MSAYREEITIVVVAAVSVLIPMLIWAQDVGRIPSVVHIDSDVSGGELSVPELVELIEENGLQVAMFTDHDNIRVEYGIRPFRNILGWITGTLTEEESIFTYGTQEYVDMFEELNAQNPGTVIIHGIETVPFYYWEGSIFKGNLQAKNWHEHLLVIGLESAEDYDNLPSIAKDFPGQYDLVTIIISLWPIALILLAYNVFLRRPPKVSKNDFLRRKRGYRRVVGISLAVLGALLLIENFPYRYPIYDQYSGNLGITPYQDVIDYVNSRGGMVFWAHPEVNQKLSREAPIAGKVEIVTAAYQNHLLEARDYAGFAAFWEGMKFTAVPGGVWDKVLLEYCRGERENPVWAIGESDFEGEFDPKVIREISTVLLTDEVTRESVLDAMRNGRMYATRNFFADYVIIDEFSTKDSQNRDVVGYSSETIQVKGYPEVVLAMTVVDRTKLRKKLNVELIRGGQVVKRVVWDWDSPIKLVDKDAPRGVKTYYRASVLTADWSVMVTNPIFVEISE